jgi:hypothetical protein
MVTRLKDGVRLIGSERGRHRIQQKLVNALVPDPVRNRFRFRPERRLLSGKYKAGNEITNSALFFTVHKCASTYVRKALRYVAEQHLDLVPVNLAAYFHNTTAVDTYAEIQARAGTVFRPKGYLYAPLRHPINVPQVEDYRIVVMLRDPRDVLTSLYYSLAVSHGLPGNRERKEDFLEMRADIRNLDIDSFVREYLPLYQARYEGFLRLTQDHDCTFLRYEDMIADFVPWAQQLGTGLGVKLSGPDISHLERLGGFDRPVEENVSKHIRQRTPGDHTRKLQPATIAFLNEQLGPVLEGFGYI